eukprot:1608361-Prymnesium_polylepis.1
MPAGGAPDAGWQRSVAADGRAGRRAPSTELRARSPTKPGPKPQAWPEARSLARSLKPGPKPEAWPEARSLARSQKPGPKPEAWP